MSNSVNPFKLYSLALTRIVDWRGRSQRRELWSFLLVNTLINVVLTPLGSSVAGFLLLLLIGFSNLLAITALFVRRLHDSNCSGWNLLLPLGSVGIRLIAPVIFQRGVVGWYVMQLICSIISFSFVCYFMFLTLFKGGTPAANKYGVIPSLGGSVSLTGQEGSSDA